jgi:hypothetical protein
MAPVAPALRFSFLSGVHILVAPGRRLGTWDNAGDVGILAAPVGWRCSFPSLGLAPPRRLELLTLLAGTLSRALVLRGT